MVSPVDPEGHCALDCVRAAVIAEPNAVGARVDLHEGRFNDRGVELRGVEFVKSVTVKKTGSTVASVVSTTVTSTDVTPESSGTSTKMESVERG